MKWYQLLKDWGGHAAGEQIQMKEENALSLVQTGFAKEVTISGDAELMASMQKAMGEKLAAPLAEAVGTAIKNAVESVKPTRIEVTADEVDKNKCFADMFRRVLIDDAEGLAKIYKSTKSSLAENTGTTGGYLVPPEYLDRLMQLTGERAIVRPRANVIPVSGRSVIMPVLDQTTVYGTGKTPFFGGISATWTSENTTRPQTNPQFKQVEISLNELSGLSPVSNILLQDSPISIDAILTQNIAGAVGWYEDDAFFFGDGVGKPKGVAVSPATIGVSRTSSNLFKYADAANMLSKLIPGSDMSAVWVMSQTVLPQLVQLSDSSGRIIYMPNPAVNTGGSATQRVPGYLFGIPVVFSEKLPPLGTSGDVMLCDFSKYIVADRPSLEIMSSPHYLFGNNQTAWRFVHRVGGQPWLDAPITYQDGSTQVSPFVRLNA